jgi:predicted extracellular nuclease
MNSFQKSIKNGLRANLIFALIVVLFLSSCAPWQNAARRNMTVVFYNVENLFDLENEPGKNDGEFTPEGEKNWDLIKYRNKLAGISRVISGINEGDLPEIVGLCEVENERVLADLVRTGLLANGKYEIVHHESPDMRGIDCALIYRPEEFKVTGHFAVPVRFEDNARAVTRDILYVKGRTRNREEFHIFVNHWPSRIGGVAQTEPKRITVARILKGKIDSVRMANSKAQIIVMGDMNDDPDNKSLLEVLNAQPPATPEATLVNLMFPDFNNGQGTYNYRGNWNMPDNLIVSPGLLDDKGFRCVEEKGHIFREEWMEFKNRNGEISPNRTYGGPNYYGGVSDHFPVYFRLRR